MFVQGIPRPAPSYLLNPPFMNDAADCKNNGRTGFTLTEVMVASALVVVLALMFFESTLFLNRMSYDVKTRLAADAIAYDEVWDLYNARLSWFEDGRYRNLVELYSLPEGVTDVWGGRHGEVLLNRRVTPQPGTGFTTNWVIDVKITWPELSGNRVSTLDYTVNRMRTQRKAFR